MHNSNVSVEKNVGGIVVGDNTHVTNNINKYDQDFLEIPLEKYGLGISPSQQLIDEMINIICHHRMLILGGIAKTPVRGRALARLDIHPLLEPLKIEN
nr:hypothetical protein [Moorena sp. SIO1G6]